MENGETVSVFNDHGEVHIQAKVTGRVIPGTIMISQGGWRNADMNGDRIDKGGCINTLCSWHPARLQRATRNTPTSPAFARFLKGGLDDD